MAKERKGFRPETITTPAQIEQLSGVEFEELLAYLYRKNGWIVDTTAASGDYGADLILRRPGRCVAVQSKRYSSNVGYDAIKEIFTAKAIYDADEAAVVSNAGFTSQAVEAAKKLDIKLLGLDDIMPLISIAQGRQEEQADLAAELYKQCVKRFRHDMTYILSMGRFCGDWIGVNGTSADQEQLWKIERPGLFSDEEESGRAPEFPIETMERIMCDDKDPDELEKLFMGRYPYLGFVPLKYGPASAVINSYYHLGFASDDDRTKQQLSAGFLRSLKRARALYFRLLEIEETMRPSAFRDGRSASLHVQEISDEIEQWERETDNLHQELDVLSEQATYSREIAEKREREKRREAEERKRRERDREIGIIKQRYERESGRIAKEYSEIRALYDSLGFFQMKQKAASIKRMESLRTEYFSLRREIETAAITQGVSLDSITSPDIERLFASPNYS